MIIKVDKLGKKYAKEWIFRNLDYTFHSKAAYAITGPNGSGKSTLLQILTSASLPTAGTIKYSTDRTAIAEEDIYRHIDIVTPHLELIEEFSLVEFLSFHFKFKKLRQGLTQKDFLELVYLEKDSDKLIQNFSSGMKQRLKLGLTFFSESEICFLDEPTSNLDEQAIEWYLKHIQTILRKKLVIISSNQKYEYDFCDSIINVTDFK
jgi:ABC-type multidrug transport system ATPase subunit